MSFDHKKSHRDITKIIANIFKKRLELDLKNPTNIFEKPPFKNLKPSLSPTPLNRSEIKNFEFYTTFTKNPSKPLP